jgi:succinoglycan biosynthesis protein ExoA
MVAGMCARVTVVIPARNEARYIEPCLASVRAQQTKHAVEVIVVDGLSKDGTADLARVAGARVVENPRRTTPTGLNIGLDKATGDFLVRFDAHAEMLPGYIEACVRALEEERGAVNVGGWSTVRSSRPWGRALGAALASPVGVGNPRIWRAPSADERRRDCDTVPLGCFRTSDLKAAGGWCEHLTANEDFELNHRLRSRGGRVVFDPSITFVYRPRENLNEIVRQYWRYGRAKAVMLALTPGSLRLRQLAPLALIGAAAISSWSPRARKVLSLYLTTICLFAARSRGGWRTAPLLAAMHLAWGAGVVTALPRALALRLRSRERVL